MPLTKLFKKRHSLKDMSLVQSVNKDIETLQSSFESPGKIEISKSQSESNLLSQSFDNQASESCSADLTSPPEEIDCFSSKYEYIEKESDECTIREKDNHSYTRRQSAPPESMKRPEIRKTKSASCEEKQSTSKIPMDRRKKCLSESETCGQDFDDKNDGANLQMGGKLEDMIEQCLNRIIKESILNAVKNVNIDGIYEEIIDNISSHRHLTKSSSEKSGSNDEKKQLDISEYAELNDSNLDYKLEELEEINNSIDDDELNDATPDSENKKTETQSLDGYSADFEESISLHSTDMELKESFPDTTIKSSENNATEAIFENMATENVVEQFNDINNEGNLVKTQINQHSYSSEGINVDISVKSDSKITKTNRENDTVEYSHSEQSVITNDKISGGEEDADLNKTAHNDPLLQNLKSMTEISKNKFSDAEDSEKTENLVDEESNLILISDEADSFSLPKSALCHRDSGDSVLDAIDNLPSELTTPEEKKTNNWKVGYLHAKLPYKARGKSHRHLKAWKKRCVSIQTDEFVNDPKNPCLMLSLYSAESGTARKHGATFWKSISGHKAVVYRSSSRTHKYAFTISDNNNIVIHLATDSETSCQEWMAEIRSILWPPSPVIQLEKMLNGKQFEISIIDNDFSFRAGLLGMYGLLTITGKKLILVHSQQGYVIQEWYLNTVDKFQLMPQAKVEDAHKVLLMTTCSDSSTGKGELIMFCPEAVAMLQAIASTIHEILTIHVEQKTGKYEKELAEIADWLIPATSQDGDDPEDYYKVPPRQVKSLLDIPNFIFDKPLTPSSTVSCSTGENMESKSLATAKSNPTRASQDSGISAGNNSEDLLNCSSASFLLGGGQFPGKSSDSELSDSYTPPRTPETKHKKISGTTLQVP